MASATQYNDALNMVSARIPYRDWYDQMRTAGIKDIPGVLNLARRNGQVKFENEIADGNVTTYVSRVDSSSAESGTDQTAGQQTDGGLA